MARIKEIEGDESTEALDLLKSIQETAGRVRESRKRAETYKVAYKAAADTAKADQAELDALTGATEEPLPLFDTGDEDDQNDG